MKGGKDEQKRMDSLFPRLHINDAEKRGPRPPPRNKMALCEQLSIPSQRYTPGSMLMLPLPLNKNSSSFSNQGGRHKRSLLPPFCSTTASTQLVERFHSYSMSGLNLTTKSTSPQQQQPLNPTKNGTLGITGHLATAAGGLFQPKSIFNSKNSNRKKLGVEDNCGVPICAQSVKRPHLSINQHSLDKERPISLIEGSRHLQTVCEQQLKRIGATDIKSRLLPGNKFDDNTKPSFIGEDHAKRTPFLSAGNKVLSDSSLSLLARGRISEPISEPSVSLNPLIPKKKSKLVDSFNRIKDLNAQSHQEHKVLQGNKAPGDCVPAELEKATKKRSASTLDGEAGSIASLGDNCNSPKRLETVSECHEDKACKSLQAEDANKKGDVSDTSVVDSISVQNVSSDDVVEVLGQKQFWKARKTIVHQQRVFAVQVFELHRLVKVQRLIAGSPELLLEDNFYTDKPIIRGSSAKNIAAENVLEQPSFTVKQKIDSQKQSSTNESTAENVVRKPPILSLNMDTVQGNLSQQSRATDVKPVPWCLPPPSGNQWLVPVRSPSEGLVYKPYAGPCPPPAGFMAQIYGSCDAMSLDPIGGDFFNTAYGLPASHQRQGIELFSSTNTPSVGHTYFSSYGMPVMNPSGSNSGVEQVSPFVRGRSGPEIRDASIPSPYQSSCNTTSKRSVVISGCGVNLQPSKRSDLQGSTASSSFERAPGGALPLFPTTPTIESSQQPSQSHSNEQRIQVIKVVPRNSKSALEAAARIFQSIQEERKQCDQLHCTK